MQVDNFQVVARGTSPDMTTVFQARSIGRFIEINLTSEERNFIERIKTVIFMKLGLAMQKMEEVQLNLEEKNSPSILKDVFCSKRALSIFILNHVYQTSQTKQVEFFQY